MCRLFVANPMQLYVPLLGFTLRSIPKRVMLEAFVAVQLTRAILCDFSRSSGQPKGMTEMLPATKHLTQLESFALDSDGEWQAFQKS